MTMRKSILAMAAMLSMFLSGSAQTAKTLEFSNPEIKVFLPEKEKDTGRAVVILPGGGYTHLAKDHEGYDWAPFFNERGIAVAVVSYRMPNGDYTVPNADAEGAVKLMRDHAAEWNINPHDVGIMGSSAGGHLASTVATHAAKETRPDFQILFYPVITMNPTYTHMGSHDNLLGKTPGKEMEDRFSNEKQVSAETPRAIILLSDDDDVVPSFNGVNYYKALHDAGVPASIYVYPTGGHGWGHRDTFKYHPQMMSDLDAWLKSF